MLNIDNLYFSCKIIAVDIKYPTNFYEVMNLNKKFESAYQSP